jgi:hypothetical protein
VPNRYATPDKDNVDICGAACETTDSFMRPSHEWLKAAARDRADLLGEPGQYGEVPPKFKGRARSRTYEYFIKRRFPSSVGRGDILAILNAGAYGAVMSSEYNSRQLVPEVLVDGQRYGVIRQRPSYRELIHRDCEPDWRTRDESA